MALEVDIINGVNVTIGGTSHSLNGKSLVDGQVINGADVIEPVTGTAVSISTGSANTTTACGQTANVTKYADSADIPLIVGSTVYNEIGLTTTYNGGGLWFRYGIGSIQIGTDGIVDATGVC